MPTKTWPASLPKRVRVDGFTEKPPNNLLRSQPQKGPAIVRKYSSAAVRPITCGVFLELWQVHVLDDFFTIDLDSGLWPFLFPNPRESEAHLGNLVGVELTTETGEVIVIEARPVLVRLVEPPTYTPLGPVVLVASMNLEVLP